MSWKEKILGDLGEVKTSTLTFKQAKDRSIDNGVSVLGVKVSDMNSKGNEVLLKSSAISFSLGGEDLIKRTVPKNSIIFPKRGAAIATNKKRITTDYTVLDPNLIAFIPHQSVDIVYVYYWFLTFDLRNIQSLGPTPQLNKKDVVPIKIPLPPLSEQKKIAAILSAVQDAREKTEAVIDAARELKKSMMKHLFTYGPVPVSEAEKVELQETEIGPVPNEWNYVKLGKVAEIKSGGTPSRKKKEYWKGNIPWIKTGNIDFNKIENADEYITKEGLENSSTRIIPKGTLLMAMYGQGVTRGKVGILNIEASINQACAAIFPEKDIEPEYLFHFFQYHYHYLREFGHGANQKNLSGTLLKTFPVVYPKKSIQKEIIKSFNSIDQKIAAETAKKEALETLFQSLLQQLMTGQLRVNSLKL